MGKIRSILPVKLISGIITADINNFNTLKEILGKKFGTVDYISPIYDFNLTDYYEEEMGDNLKRQFLSFSKLIVPADLVKIKHFTNKLEIKYSKNGKRLINLDPGYIAASKLILVTTKDYYHRIYLNKGIFAEVTLFFKDGGFKPLDWTYPDYKTEEYIKTFNRIREIYIKQIKN